MVKGASALNKEGTEREQAVRWAQHFEEVTNQPEPEEWADPEPLNDIDIKTDSRSQAEVETAVKQMNKKPAPGIDSLQAEILLADIRQDLGAKCHPKGLAQESHMQDSYERRSEKL